MAGLLVVLLVAAQALLGAAAAQALPRGAYWYTVLELKRAWQITEGAGVTVAVVDSGVQASVNTLRGQVKPGLDLSGDDPKAQHEVPLPGEGDFGHGTDMAALIAGTGNGGGLRGVAPKAKILPVDVDGRQNKPTTAHIAQGITWAVSHGADIINLSLGSTDACTDPLRAAVADAYRHDVLVVASAGDSASQPVAEPASCPGALAIGGIDAAAKPWANTPSGADIDFVAPAFNLVNQLLDGKLNGPAPGNAGTSQAAAIVSGTFALLKARFPHDTDRQLVTRALYNVHNGLGQGKQGVRAGDRIGYGVILPVFALTTAPPADAKNPIYDRFASELPSATAGSSTSPASSTAPSTPAAVGSTPAAGATAASSSGGSSTSAILIVVIVVVVLGAGAIVTVVLARSRRARRPPPPTGGYPGGGYPPVR